MSPITRLIQQFKNNKPKAVVAAIALALMCLMWGRLLLQGAPRTSTADPGESSDTAASERTESGPLPVVRLDDATASVRDPFAFDDNPYKRTARNERGDDELSPDPQSPDPAAQATRLRRDLERIDLQSIVAGNPPVVMIDGRILRVGDAVQGFTIASINHADRTVDFTQDNLTFRVKP